MFRPVPRTYSMKDPERGYLWRDLGSTQKGEIDIASITIAGQEIVYEYHVDEQRDSTGVWCDIQLGMFGASVAGQIRERIETVKFSLDTEREAAILVAIEATLAWLPSGLALEKGDGYNRLTYKGIQYRLSDFGPYFNDVGASA